MNAQTRPPIDATLLSIMLSPFPSDDEKISILQRIAPHVRITGDELLGIVKTFSSDKGKESATNLLSGAVKDTVPEEKVMCSTSAGQLMSAEALFKMLSTHASDDEKIKSLRDNAHLLRLDGGELVGLVRLFSSDKQKISAVKILSDTSAKIPVNDGQLSEIMQTCSSDAGQCVILAILSAPLNAVALRTMLSKHPSDDAKGEILELVAEHVHLNGDELVALVRLFSSDSAKISAVQLLSAASLDEGKVPFASLLSVMENCYREPARCKIVEILLPKLNGEGPLTHTNAVAILGKLSTDTMRLECLKTLAKVIKDITTAELLKRYVETFRHDTDAIRLILKERIKIPTAGTAEPESKSTSVIVAPQPQPLPSEAKALRTLTMTFLVRRDKIEVKTSDFAIDFKDGKSAITGAGGKNLSVSYLANPLRLRFVYTLTDASFKHGKHFTIEADQGSQFGDQPVQQDLIQISTDWAIKCHTRVGPHASNVTWGVGRAGNLNNFNVHDGLTMSLPPMA